jgi:hypothetical protein
MRALTLALSRPTDHALHGARRCPERGLLLRTSLKKRGDFLFTHLFKENLYTGLGLIVRYDY